MAAGSRTTEPSSLPAQPFTAVHTALSSSASATLLTRFDAAVTAMLLLVGNPLPLRNTAVLSLVTGPCAGVP